MGICMYYALTKRSAHSSSLLLWLVETSLVPMGGLVLDGEVGTRDRWTDGPTDELIPTSWYLTTTTTHQWRWGGVLWCCCCGR